MDSDQAIVEAWERIGHSALRCGEIVRDHGYGATLRAPFASEYQELLAEMQRAGAVIQQHMDTRGGLIELLGPDGVDIRTQPPEGGGRCPMNGR